MISILSDCCCVPDSVPSVFLESQTSGHFTVSLSRVADTTRVQHDTFAVTEFDCFVSSNPKLCSSYPDNLKEFYVGHRIIIDYSNAYQNGSIESNDLSSGTLDYISQLFSFYSAFYSAISLPFNTIIDGVSCRVVRSAKFVQVGLDVSNDVNYTVNYRIDYFLTSIPLDV